VDYCEKAGTGMMKMRLQDKDLKKVKRRDIVCLIHFRNVVSHFGQPDN